MKTLIDIFVCIGGTVLLFSYSFDGGELSGSFFYINYGFCVLALFKLLFLCNDLFAQMNVIYLYSVIDRDN